MVGKKGIIPPGENATDEDWQKVFDGLGRPPLEDVQLEIPEPEPLHREAEVRRREPLHPEELGVEAHGLLEVVGADADMVQAGRPQAGDRSAVRGCG